MSCCTTRFPCGVPWGSWLELPLARSCWERSCSTTSDGPSPRKSEVFAIEVDGVSKGFRRRTIESATTLKTSVVDLLLGRRRALREPVFQALRDITFTV